MRTGTRVEVLDAFWLYIKTKKLQDVENKEIINSDDLIRQVKVFLCRRSRHRSLPLQQLIKEFESYLYPFNL
jgi:hypothetical protein